VFALITNYFLLFELTYADVEIAGDIDQLIDITDSSRLSIYISNVLSDCLILLVRLTREAEGSIGIHEIYTVLLEYERPFP
jgi:hypothetical protein